MANRRNLVVIALASVLVGALAGIGTLQYAQVIAFGAMNPNVAAESVPNPRVSLFKLKWGYTGIVKTPVEPAEPVEQVRGAAPDIVTPKKGCEGLSGQRLTKCNAGTIPANETNR